jgi:hypothetical protein
VEFCEVGKGKRVDVYLEVRKRRGHIFFELLYGIFFSDAPSPCAQKGKLYIIYENVM